MMHFFKQILCGSIFLFSLSLLAGCGSSGSSSSDTPADTEKSFTSTVALFDEAGETTDTISEGNPGHLKVTVKTSTGSVAAKQFITVTTSKGSFLNSDGTAITNSSGVAEFTLVAGDATGAGTIDVAVGDSTLTNQFAFQIGAPASVKLGAFINGNFKEGVLLSSISSGEKLSIGGTASITAALALQDGSTYTPYTKSVDISFTTLCSTAIVDKTVATENGVATSTYRGDRCTSGADKVTATASIAGSNLSASIDLSLATPEVGSITFEAANPTHLALAGTANLKFPTISALSFIVKDEVGNPVANELVNFSLLTPVGGISISPSSAETNSEGKVFVTVSSGDVPTSVSVKATVNDTQISTISSNLVISTGLADQNSFSISAGPFNPEAWAFDGVEVDVTVRAADHFNNPVPDGTSISFTTEGGVIDPYCSTVGGVCSVKWRSQDPRPSNGRVTILATAIGEESFTDVNGSGRFESSADKLDEDLGEAFVDADEDDIRDVDEAFLDYNGDLLYTGSNGSYNGTLCEEGCSEELVHVREDIVLTMSASTASITINPPSITLSGLVQVAVTVADINGNSMPGGTTIAFTTPGNASIEGETSREIEDNATLPETVFISLKPDGTSASGTESSLQVKVTTPKGTVTTASAICTTPAPTPTP